MKVRDKVYFFVSGLAGVILTLAIFVLINQGLVLKRKKNQLKSAQFSIVKSKPKPRIKSRPKKTPPKKIDLKPRMQTSLKGLSFGIPAFELDMGLDQGSFLNGEYVDGSLVEQKPSVIYRPDLEFPEEALSENISGYVLLGVFIDKRGRVQKVQILESKPKGVFDRVARENLKLWRFHPAKHKGVEVATWQEQRIVFNSNEGGV